MVQNQRGNKMKDETDYIITKDCFVGKKGDHIVVDWNGRDGANWENLTKGSIGCPFVEKDCVRKIGGGSE